jgi:two-component sensor histidine kinase
MEAYDAGAAQMNEDGLDVREANHRMMNMLALLLALFHRNFSKFSDQGVRGAVTKFENQIIAASELLRTISSTPTAEDAAVDVYLERLGRTLSSAVLSPTNTSFELFVDQGWLPIDVCERLGLIIVELVINASKYAFADRENGVVRIDMIRSGRNWRCIVSDNGIGMDGADRSMGLNIVDALVRSLKGRLIIRSRAVGTCVCVVLPDHSLPRRRSELDAIAAAHVPVDSAQKSHPTNRMGNRFAFATPTMAFNGGNDEIRP